MRRDKTVARILLVFSIANVALAVPGRYLDVARAASEKWASPDDESMPELVSGSDSYLSAQSSDVGSEDYFTAPQSPDEPPPVPPSRWHQFWGQLPSESSDQDSASGSSAGPSRHSEASLAEWVQQHAAPGPPAGSETSDQDSASYSYSASTSHVSSDEDHVSELSSEDSAPKPPSRLSLQGSASESPFSSSHYKSVLPESTLPAKTVNDKLKKGMKYLGAIVLSAGIIYGAKMILGPVSAHPYVSALFPPSPADI